LANVYLLQGNCINAEGLFKRALVIREIALGASRPAAEALFKRALVIREQALGASHPDVGQTLTNLANVYRDQGKYGETEGLLKRALSITENAKGGNHPTWPGPSLIWHCFIGRKAETETRKSSTSGS
jgi:tetratricopeptide (TPR) repeat protein